MNLPEDPSDAFAAGAGVGILVVPATLFGMAVAVWLWRRICHHVLHAKPAHLSRRLRLAAEFVDGRRAYRVGGRRLWIAAVVGRQWQHDQQAYGVLADEFLPTPAPDGRQ